MGSARRKQAAVVLWVLAGLCPCAPALNPSLDISQYAHTSWTIREGFFKGWITAMAQTADGYLWLGTEFGLLRFDGVRPAPWTPPGSERLPSPSILRLLAARDGTLWIGTGAGLVSWNGSQLTHYPQLEGQRVGLILDDRDGTVWTGGVSAGTGRLCAIRAGKAECFGQDGSLGRAVLCLYEDRKGNLWAGAFSGLWLWKPGPPKYYPMPEMLNEVFENDDGELLMLMPGGVRRLESGKARPYPMGGPSIPRHVLRDRDGGLWIGTSGQGLLHVHHGRTDAFSRTDGLSADAVFGFFEDREGNIWVSTYGGLDRFRELPVVSLSAKQGLSGDSVSSVLAARDGSIWLSGRNGLDRWKNGQVTTFRKAQGLPDDGPHSLFQDKSGRIWAFSLHGCAYFEDGRFVAVRDVPGGYMPAIAADADNLWVSADTGLLRLLEGRLVEQFPWPRLGRQGQAIAFAADRGRGGLWLGFVGGGVSYFKDGQVRRSYTGADGLGEGYVTDLRLETDGTLWASTQNGLSLIKEEHVTTLTSRNGLPCDQVHWSVEADDRSTWLYMACGLVRIARADLDAWMAGALRKIPVTVLEGSDGVTTHASPGSMSPRVAKSIDGRIWFVSYDGISVVDPRHLPVNKLPPPVHIESIIADDKPYELRPGMRLPANVRSLRIDYTALSLVAPEKIHFKYMLDGQDRRLARSGQRTPGEVHQPSAAQVPLPRHRLQQQRRVERNRRHAGVLHRAGVLSDRVVLRVVRGRLSGHALGAVPAAAVSDPAGVQRAVGRARGGADARRAGAARYAPAELSGFADPDAGRAQHFRPAPGKGRAKPRQSHYHGRGGRRRGAQRDPGLARPSGRRRRSRATAHGGRPGAGALRGGAGESTGLRA